MIRSRAKWLEKGERITKYFLTLEKSGFDRNRISEIKNKQGSIVTDHTRILSVLKLYFEKFYQIVISSDAMQIDACLKEVNLRSLSSNQTVPVTIQECLTALLEMSNNKSPGSDGISVLRLV